MNLTDLRELLDERSDLERVDVRSHLMLDRVHHGIKVRRRRRQAATVIAATVAVLAVGAGTFTFTNRTPTDRTAPVAGPHTTSNRMIAGFPEFAAGAQVIAAKSATADSVSVTFVPTSLDLVFFERCSPTQHDEHSLAINGVQFAVGEGCGGSFSAGAALLTKQFGVKLGTPATLTMTVKGHRPHGEIGAAVGVAMDPSAYPYPPRPSTLAPLDLPSGSDWRIIRSDPADPEQVVQTTLAWPGTTLVSLRTNSPGAMTVKIDGVLVLSAESWDYNVGDHGGPDVAELERLGLHLTTGKQVTITVTPERMTGDWALMLGR